MHLPVVWSNWKDVGNSKINQKIKTGLYIRARQVFQVTCVKIFAVYDNPEIKKCAYPEGF